MSFHLSTYSKVDKWRCHDDIIIPVGRRGDYGQLRNGKFNFCFSGLVYWTGDGETGVSRDELLELLAEKMEEKDVLHWGVQCNRAMRMLFPDVQMKRKGKYKTYPFYED